MSNLAFVGLLVLLILSSGVQVEKWAASAFHGRYYSPLVVWLVVMGAWATCFLVWFIQRQ